MKKIFDTRKNKKIYCWNKKTMVYSGTSEATPCVRNVEDWDIPSNATIIEPPKEKEGYVVKWNGEKWVSSKA